MFFTVSPVLFASAEGPVPKIAGRHSAPALLPSNTVQESSTHPVAPPYQRERRDSVYSSGSSLGVTPILGSSSDISPAVTRSSSLNSQDSSVARSNFRRPERCHSHGSLQYPPRNRDSGVGMQSVSDTLGQLFLRSGSSLSSPEDSPTEHYPVPMLYNGSCPYAGDYSSDSEGSAWSSLPRSRSKHRIKKSSSTFSVSHLREGYSPIVEVIGENTEPVEPDYWVNRKRQNMRTIRFDDRSERKVSRRVNHGLETSASRFSYIAAILNPVLERERDSQQNDQKCGEPSRGICSRFGSLGKINTQERKKCI